MGKRLIWADQAKGIGIFLMVYAHNFPFNETYIYTFHMPLFFFIAGMFQPKTFNLQIVKKRANSILVPYFIWSLLLYLFWLFLGRHYGDSVKYDLDPINSFIGIFYAQGGVDYMNWGIPMWFLPSVFLTFVLFSLILKTKTFKYFIFLIAVGFGFVYPFMSDFKLPWSFDVSCVSLAFYGMGYLLKPLLIKINKRKAFLFLAITIVVHFTFVFISLKVDMYRSIYGNPLLFIINGLSGTIALILILKIVKLPKIITYLGQHTLTILACHLRALTIIKFGLVLIGVSLFNFDEFTKFAFSILQIALILPVIFVVNKYAPFLDGKIK